MSAIVRHLREFWGLWLVTIFAAALTFPMWWFLARMWWEITHAVLSQPWCELVSCTVTGKLGL